MSSLVETTRSRQTHSVGRTPDPIPAPARRPVRICHLSMHLLTGGLERLLVEYARLHDRDRFELEFVALDQMGRPAEEIIGFGCPASTLEFPRRGKWATWRALCKLLRRGRFDVLHTHNTYAHYLGTLAARWVGVPIIINTQHGRGAGNSWKARLQFILANRFSQKIVGVSEDCLDLLRLQDPFSRRKMTRIWNSIDMERFAFRGPGSSMSAISVGRLSPEKDFPTMLRAVAIAVQTIPDFRLRIVGQGAERPRLEALANELGISQNVDFLGERSDVPQLLSESGFFINSSLSEGVSLTLVEASAVGIPIVATSAGGNPEIVIHDRSGLIVPIGDSQSLADAILEMCRRKDQWPAMAAHARKHAEHGFEIRQMIKNYENIYSQLLSHTDRPIR